MAKSILPRRGGARNIYMDYAASALPNPGSVHALGAEAKRKLENARRALALALGTRPQEIIFTSGGTEGNNLAIQGAVYAAGQENFSRPHLVTTNIEHPSVLETFKMLEKRKIAEITIVPVESNGIADPRKIRKALKKNTALVSVMYANNEIGTIQPVKEIARAIRHFRKQNKTKYPFFHTDAVQAANYLELGVEKLGADLLTLSGSKVEGAGRVGILYKKKGVPLAKILGGGDQEQGLRPGTENLSEIIKFARAFAEARKAKDKEAERLKNLQNYFSRALEHSRVLKNAGMIINGDKQNRLPNNINITVPKIPSDLLVIELSARGIMCSSKSACESSRAEGSYVIEALRPGADPAIGGVRFSLGSATKKKDIDYAVKSLEQILQKLEKWYT